MKKVILGIMVVSVFLLGAFLGSPVMQFFSQVITPIPQPIVRTYDMYNTTYFPYEVKVVYYPGNYTNLNLGLPTSWEVTNGGQSHNAAFTTTCTQLIQGVVWQQDFAHMAGAALIPLSAPQNMLPGANVMGTRSALVMLTQMVGEPLGVTLADNLLFVEEDSGPGSIFAVNPLNGQVVWYATGLASYAMNNPIVYNGIVFVTVGDVGFNFANFVHYEKGQFSSIHRGMAYGAIYAFNATDGELLWMKFTMGEAMPAPAVYDGILAYSDGGGEFIGVNATTGQVLWMDSMPGLFDSMSSVNYYVMPNGTPIFIAGFTSLSQPFGLLVAVDGLNGKEVWNATLPSPNRPFNTGMGDVPPAVDQQLGIVVQSTVANAEPNGTVDTLVVGVNATTGQVLWVTNLGRGYTPPAFKGAIPTIYNGTVYVGAPSLGKEYAINIKTGQILWQTRLNGISTPPSAPGGPRGGATYYDNLLWVVGGPNVYVLNPKTGEVLQQYYVGGRFGIVNPVIVGSTMYLTNSYGWVIAIPLYQVYPNYVLYA
ncbi:PQQ-binding-like beta-propeller repeat protein [Metallosphaera tengchongensis]|uniref:PQQ-binding-like beta-propeller repeat protein n=1 Tax=Metallosphaera tengchongensis TaxID=1532350 RepID=A0A6N0NZU1_9CREN|nr:PQQ-binding-like beta-propeller repeat protein [Metallosphaera tengchongensis]QKR00580.1 PQQ-binding-like beta-propeller repeat protein [Metallosphaera tengchongensis]